MLILGAAENRIGLGGTAAALPRIAQPEMPRSNRLSFEGLGLYTGSIDFAWTSSPRRSACRLSPRACRRAML